MSDGLARQTMAMKGRSVRRALKRSFNEPTLGVDGFVLEGAIAIPVVSSAGYLDAGFLIAELRRSMIGQLARKISTFRPIGDRL